MLGTARQLSQPARGKSASRTAVELEIVSNLCHNLNISSAHFIAGLHHRSVTRLAMRLQSSCCLWFRHHESCYRSAWLSSGPSPDIVYILAGAGVAVGSSVGFMVAAMAEEEAKSTAVAHTPLEKKVVINRGFAAAGAQH